MLSFLLSWLFFSSGAFSLIMGLFVMQNTSMALEVALPSFLMIDMSLIFLVDYISLLFFATVSLITSVVFLYSKYYLDISSMEKSDQNRFLIVLLLFVISMMLLVFSYSWFLVMVGWDGLGLVSFLLVVYYNNSKSMDSGMITVLTNRVGDCFFLLSFMFMFYLGSFSFSYLSHTEYFLFLSVVTLGAITKSAQMPFSSWLPAAMAAPTPVSSLVHSSTLVTAGVFLLIRFNLLLSPTFYFLSIIALLTMTTAGIYANYELDFKKVVAMSTLSQLGFMIFTITTGNYLLAFLHVLFHAFFKSVLFLSTGSLMHFLFSNQDSRLFSTFFMSFFSKLFFTMSCLSLMGFPFMLGFYSKDSIIASLLFNELNLMTLMFSFSCCLTVAYSARLISMAFLKYAYYDTFINFDESPMFFTPVVMLFLFNILIGDYFLFFLLDTTESFSFFDAFSGLIIITLGVLMNKYNKLSYSLESIFLSMGLLPNLIISMSKKFMKTYSFKIDLSWNEIFAAKGVKILTDYPKTVMVSMFNTQFSMLFVITVIFILIFF